MSKACNFFALNWSMEMVGARVDFFKFSASIGVILDKFKSFQNLKLVGSYFGMIKCADLKAIEKPFEYCLK